MKKAKPNLLDPDFEPTDGQLRVVTRAALRAVRARADAADKPKATVGRKAKSRKSPVNA